MADPRVFTLIGNFDDNITKHLVQINKNLEQVKANLESVSKTTKPLKNDFKELADLGKSFSDSLRGQASDIRDTTAALRALRSEMGRVNRAYRAAGRNRNIVPPPPPPPRPPRNTLPPPPPPPPPITPGRYARGAEPPRYGRGRPPEPPQPPRGGGRESVLGDVISGNLISNAIIQGFQVGVGILQQGMAAAFGAIAERTKDQLEDIGAAGGIFSAARFSNIPGFPKTFQGAMEMQDKINKEMATIASTLPGTTHDYVANSRRLVDTTAQVMARDMKGFMSLATELTGKMNISAEEAFRVVNVEIAKATTMLEKLNPAQTVIPMTQLVEDMMKDEKVTIGGLRRYVSFRRSTTFEAALQRNIDELNKAGLQTAGRLKMIIKVLKEAAPPEMVGAFQASVAGVTEGFRSAFLDPDVGLFGLSRTLSFEVKKFDRETGKYIGKEFSNFFKMFSEVFGNIGNLINNSILPGLQALYQPFEGIAKQFEKLREVSYKIFERQQQYNAYYGELAAGFGMRREDFKVFEKAGITTLMNVLEGFGMLDRSKYLKYIEKMKAKGTPEEIAKNMKEIYADIIPTVFKSPFFKEIGKTLGNALAAVFKEIAKVMKALLRGDYGSNEFLKAFYDAGGMDAINEILMYVAEGIGKAIMKIAEVYVGALAKAIGSGNFAAAGVLGALGLVFGAPAIAGIKIIANGIKMLVDAFKFLVDKLPKLGKKGADDIIEAKVRDLGATPKALPPGKTTPALPASALTPVTKGMGAFANFMSKMGTWAKGVGPRFLGFFKGFFGKLTILGGVLTTVTSLFSGKDLATSLAEGAGPVLGAALGAALIPFLGPIGPMIGAAIGGWIGSMKSVTEPLTAALNSVFGTLGTTFDFLIQIGRDIGGVLNGVARAIPGVSKEFDLLRWAINALLSPFRLLELMVTGLYEGYLRIKEIIPGLGLSDEERRKKNELFIMRMEKTAATEIALRDGYNKKFLEERRKELADLQAAGKGEEERARIVTAMIKQLEQKLKVPSTTTTAPKPAAAAEKPTTPKVVPTAKPIAGDKIQADLRARAAQDIAWFWKQLTTPPKQPTKAKATPVGERLDKDIPKLFSSKEIQKTAQDTAQLNAKATKQVSATEAAKKATDSVKTATDATKTAVVSQTSALNTVKAGVSSIFALLASGGLRVQTQQQNPNIFINGQLQKNGKLGDLPFPTTPPDPTKPSPIYQWRAKGGLGDAIASEMKNKPSGSDLVIANTSETVIPAAGGYGMESLVQLLENTFTTISRQVTGVGQGVNSLKSDVDGKFQTAEVKNDTRYQQAETKNSDRFQKTTAKINEYQKYNQEQFAKIGENIMTLSQKVASMSSMGGMLGGLGGGMDLGGGYGGAGVQIAGQLGNYIKQTGGAPGSIHEHPMHGGVKGRHAPGSYHYSGRAIDIGAYANEQAGVIARIKAFNAKMGVKPVEFLHAGNDPNHQDHVHVAYAGGPGKPAFFPEQWMAESWEKKHIGPGIKSITTNTAELSQLARNAGPSTPVKYDEFMRQFVPNPGAGRPGDVRLKTPMLPQAMGEKTTQLAQAGDGMFGPGWMPWNWSKLVDQERKTNKLNSTNRAIEEMVEKGYISPNSLYRQDTSSAASGPTTINAPITIHQQPGEDGEALANRVATMFMEAVSTARSSSIFA